MDALSRHRRPNDLPGSFGSLGRKLPEIERVSKANCVQMAHSISTQQHIDIAIVDLILPDGKGCELATSLVQQHPDIQLIILSGAAQEFICPSHLLDSINGVIDKTDAFEALRNCLNQIIQPVHQTLTERQKQIYGLIGEGKSNKEIAQEVEAQSPLWRHRKAIARHMSLSGAELIRAAALNQHIQKID